MYDWPECSTKCGLESGQSCVQGQKRRLQIETGTASSSWKQAQARPTPSKPRAWCVWWVFDKASNEPWQEGKLWQQIDGCAACKRVPVWLDIVVEQVSDTNFDLGPSAVTIPLSTSHRPVFHPQGKSAHRIPLKGSPSSSQSSTPAASSKSPALSRSTSVQKQHFSNNFDRRHPRTPVAIPSTHSARSCNTVPENMHRRQQSRCRPRPDKAGAAVRIKGWN